MSRTVFANGLCVFEKNVHSLVLDAKFCINLLHQTCSVYWNLPHPWFFFVYLICQYMRDMYCDCRFVCFSLCFYQILLCTYFKLYSGSFKFNTLQLINRFFPFIDTWNVFLCLLDSILTDLISLYLLISYFFFASIWLVCTFFISLFSTSLIPLVKAVCIW